MSGAQSSEQARREQAYANRGKVVETSAREIQPRRLDQVVSLRLDPEVIVALRGIAERRGSTVSDVLREGAARVIEAEEKQRFPQITHLVVKTVSPMRIYQLGQFATEGSTQSPIRQ